jgi:hypothetical protein
VRHHLIESTLRLTPRPARAFPVCLSTMATSQELNYPEHDFENEEIGTSPQLQSFFTKFRKLQMSAANLAGNPHCGQHVREPPIAP